MRPITDIARCAALPDNRSERRPVELLAVGRPGTEFTCTPSIVRVGLLRRSHDVPRQCAVPDQHQRHVVILVFVVKEAQRQEQRRDAQEMATIEEERLRFMRGASSSHREVADEDFLEAGGFVVVNGWVLFVDQRELRLHALSRGFDFLLIADGLAILNVTSDEGASCDGFIAESLLLRRFECARDVCVVGAFGKDTWIARHASELPQISLDTIREETGTEPTGNRGAVVQAAREKGAGAPLLRGRFHWNATSLGREIRGQVVDLLTAYEARFKIVYVEASRDLFWRRTEIGTRCLQE